MAASAAASAKKTFKARFESAVRMKQCVEAIKEIAREATMQCNAQGITISAISTSQTVYVKLDMRVDGFDRYKCDDAMALGMSLVNLCTVLKIAGDDDWLDLKADEDSDRLEMTIHSPDLCTKTDFSFKLMDIGGDSLDVPPRAPDAVVEMSSRKFKTMLGDMLKMAKFARLSVENGVFSMSCDGDLGPMTTQMRATPPEAKESDRVSIECTRAVAQNFMIRPMEECTKATPLSDRVFLYFTNDQPFEVRYAFKHGDLCYFLAHMVENDAEE